MDVTRRFQVWLPLAPHLRVARGSVRHPKFRPCSAWPRNLFRGSTLLGPSQPSTPHSSHPPQWLPSVSAARAAPTTPSLAPTTLSSSRRTHPLSAASPLSALVWPSLRPPVPFLTDKQVAVAFLSTGFAEAILWLVGRIPPPNRHTNSQQPAVIDPIDRRHHDSQRARRDIRDGDEHLYDGLEDHCTIRLDGAVALMLGSTSDPWAAFGGCNLMLYLIPSRATRVCNASTDNIVERKGFT